VPDRYVQAIGVMNERGRVRAAVWRKFRQINEFLRIIEQTLPGDDDTSQPIRVVDCGCRSAYLTSAA
jgi:hypothetical protein